MDMLGLVAYVAVTFMGIVGLLAVLMPFFVLRIRNELIVMNRNLERLIELVESSPRPLAVTGTHGAPRFCRNCGSPNRPEDTICSTCRGTIANG
jgi:hypothetical protein